MSAGHGPNIGHGYVKYVIIDPAGVELPPVVFPAQIARAARAVAGGLVEARHVRVGDVAYWTGDDAGLAPSPITMLAQERLGDPTFIPALVAGALDRFGCLNGSSVGQCVTGLPATWAEQGDSCRALGQRLRDAYPYERIRVIAEPLGLAYSAILDNDGQVAGDTVLTEGRIGVVDLGHHTVDVAELLKLAVAKGSFGTWQQGTATPLRQIQARLSASFERELSLAETDQAVRGEGLFVHGDWFPLPQGWDRPFVEQSQIILARLREVFGRGGRLDAILVGGGGAEERRIVEPILAYYPHARIVPQPQTAIARGYARLARRLGRRLSEEPGEAPPRTTYRMTSGDNYRARKAGAQGEITDIEWDTLRARFGGRCVGCGQVGAGMDHIVPLSRGGMHTIDNIQPLCQSCNSAKRNEIIDLRNRPFPGPGWYNLWKRGKLEL
jgi:5-methylcytosine-specific restriction endonuclease McrA